MKKRVECQEKGIQDLSNIRLYLKLKVDLHSFSSRETFGHFTFSLDSLLAEFNLPSQIIVGPIRVMMKETKAFDTRFDG